MQRSAWDWRERLSVAVAVVLFLVFLRPMFDVSHPMGSDNLTARLIAAVFMSALCSSGGAALLYLMLKA
jgi:hypothetical protein